MIYVGLAIVALGAGAVLYDYVSSLRRSKDSYEQVCSFLVYVRGEIEGSSKPLEEIVREYFDNERQDASLIAGAFSSMPRSIDLSSLCVLREDKERIRLYFDSFGTSLSKEEELRRLNALVSPIEQRSLEMRESVDKRIKSFYLIYASAVLSAVLLAS